jgi:triphosphoribosyl-dephospho-CoA synthase
VKPPLTVGQCAALACLIEATAPKPGNVHRGADFDDLTYPDLISAGIAIAPVLDQAAGRRLGATVHEAVSATRRLVRSNANLGTILLLSPLAAVPPEQSLADGLPAVLAALDAEDARLVYEAIRLANPGGLGTAPQADVFGPPPPDLIAAMRLAADRDLVARQYVNGFREVFGHVLTALVHGQQRGWPLTDTVVHAHLSLMSQFPDSLIARKRGSAAARQAADHAHEVLASGEPGSRSYRAALADLDFWLRSDGQQRNPGTTADLVAAGLFLALRENLLDLPLAWYRTGPEA